MLKPVEVMPVGDEQTPQTVLPKAFQIANQQFAELMQQDDRMLPAQARKRLMVGGTRNTYHVNVETQFDVDDLSKIDIRRSLETEVEPLRFVRTGMPVFVGEGADEAQIISSTQKNLQQILDATGKRKAHLLALNTKMQFEHQDKMLQTLEDISENDAEQFAYSNVPVNLLGTAYPAKISALLSSQMPQQYLHPRYGQKAERLEISRDLLLAAAQKPEHVSVVMCASGQDRTGGVVEASIQKHTLDQWVAHQQKKGINPTVEQIQHYAEQIQQSRTLGVNAAEIASFTSPGSPGMKEVSIANDYRGNKRVFSLETQRALYRKSADQNTKNPISSEVGKKLGMTSNDDKEQFKKAWSELQQICNVDMDKDSVALRDIKRAGQKLLAEFDKPEEEPFMDESEVKENPLYWIQRKLHIMQFHLNQHFISGKKAVFGSSGLNNAKDMMYMTKTLISARTAIESLEAGDYAQLDKEVDRLECLKKKLPGHKSLAFQVTAFCLVVLLFVALIVAANSTPFTAMAFAAAGVLAAALATTAVNMVSSSIRNVLLASKHVFIAGLEGREANVTREFKTTLKYKGEEIKRSAQSQSPESDDSNVDKGGPSLDHTKG